MANNNKNNQQANPGEDNRENKGSENKEKAPKKNLTRVKFNQAHTPYLKGEVAGLEPERAKKLIEAKICSKV